MRSAGGYLAATLLLLRLAERLGPMFGARERFHEFLAIAFTVGFPIFIVVARRSASGLAGAGDVAGEGELKTVEPPDGVGGIEIPVLPLYLRRPPALSRTFSIVDVAFAMVAN